MAGGGMVGGGKKNGTGETFFSFPPGGVRARRPPGRGRRRALGPPGKEGTPGRGPARAGPRGGAGRGGGGRRGGEVGGAGGGPGETGWRGIQRARGGARACDPVSSRVEPRGRRGVGRADRSQPVAIRVPHGVSRRFWVR